MLQYSPLASPVVVIEYLHCSGTIYIEATSWLKRIWRIWDRKCTCYTYLFSCCVFNVLSLGYETLLICLKFSIHIQLCIFYVSQWSGISYALKIWWEPEAYPVTFTPLWNFNIIHRDTGILSYYRCFVSSFSLSLHLILSFVTMFSHSLDHDSCVILYLTDQFCSHLQGHFTRFKQIPRIISAYQQLILRRPHWAWTQIQEVSTRQDT